MCKSGYITREEYNELIERPLGIKYSKEKSIEGSGDYFQAFLRQYMMEKKPERKTIKNAYARLRSRLYCVGKGPSFWLV